MDAHAAFQVRRATLQDADVFTAQRSAMFREMRTLAAGPEADRLEAAMRAALRSAVERGTCLAWLAHTPAGEFVGSSALYLAERLPSPSNPIPVEGYIAHVFVVSPWRRRGVGAALVRAATDEAGARGLVRVRLHATESGRALYERLGFGLRSNDMELVIGQDNA